MIYQKKICLLLYLRCLFLFLCIENCEKLHCWQRAKYECNSNIFSLTLINSAFCFHSFWANVQYVIYSQSRHMVLNAFHVFNLFYMTTCIWNSLLSVYNFKKWKTTIFAVSMLKMWLSRIISLPLLYSHG